MMSSLVIYGKGKAMGALSALLKHLHITFVQMDDADADIHILEAADSIIATPGIKPSHWLYQDFGQKIISELTYIARLRAQGHFSWWRNDSLKIIGITGTNGKSTTTWLTYQALSQIFLYQTDVRVWMGGNFDQPLSSLLLEIEQWWLTGHKHIIVLETSSFMLWRLRDFRFDIGVFLNIAHDHLDRHLDMDDYFAAKAEILFASTHAITSGKIMRQFDSLVYRKKVPWRKDNLLSWMQFQITHLLSRWKSNRNGLIIYTPYTNYHNPYFTGEHNHENFGAVHSILTALLVEYDRKVLDTIPPIPHRKQDIGQIDGICIIDDSISTSTHALHAALRAMTEKVVLLAWGYDKGNDYSIMAEPLRQKVAYLVCYGAVGAQLYALAMQYGIASTIVYSLEEGVLVGLEMAKKHHLTTLLYSPGAASFDLFDNVYHRIRVFDDIIARLRSGELVCPHCVPEKITDKKNYYGGMLSQFRSHGVVDPEVFRTMTTLPSKLPKDYVDFMCLHNGGEGMIGQTHLLLYPIDDLVMINQKYDAHKPAKFFIIGESDESHLFALDMRSSKSIDYVMTALSFHDDEMVSLGSSMKTFFERLYSGV